MNDAGDRRSAGDPGRSGVQVTSPLVDADLCRRLHARGSARGRDGLRDLWMALDGGVGVPFGQRRAGSYDWLRDTPLDAEHLAMVEDLCSKVVTLERARGNAAAAQRAAQVAVMVGASSPSRAE